MRYRPPFPKPYPDYDPTFGASLAIKMAHDIWEVYVPKWARTIAPGFVGDFYTGSGVFEFTANGRVYEVTVTERQEVEK